MTAEQTRKLFHDLKNDMAAMTALTNLHKLYKDSYSSEDLLNRIFERQTVISSAYEKLYQLNNYPYIELSKYINDVYSKLSRSFSTHSPGVQVQKQVPDLQLHLKRALPLVQIIVELLSNSYRHAFTGKTVSKAITINISEENGNLTAIYADNGIGFPENFIPSKSRTLGMQFITSLTKQIGGKLEFESPGSGVSVSLKMGME
jgi:two-component sensor histidine kinase